MKARIEFMEAIIIILAAAFLIESIVLGCMFASREKAAEKAEEYKFRFESLHDQHNALLLEKARLEEKNWKLETEIEELNKALLAALTAQPAAETQQEEPEPSENAAKERLPEGVATNRYDCEGFKFPEGTAQYKLQQLCINDWETGIRIFTRDNIRYRCVAMGTAYGIDIGDAWEVTLNNGYSFPIVLADYQHDITVIDPDDFGERFAYDDNGDIIDVLRNYDGEECVHVLEFIADLDAIPQAAKEAGGMHGLTIFGGKFGDGGNIAKLKYLGRVWEP